MKAVYLFALFFCIIALVASQDPGTEAPTDPPNTPTILPSEKPTINPTTPADTPTKTPTDTPTVSPTSAPTTNGTCSANADCGSCTNELKCVWCGDSCIDGFFYGPPDLKQCDDWRWKQCKVNGRFAFIGVLIATGVVFLLIFICLCKCFCCQKKKKSKATKLSEFKSKKVERERLLGDEEAQVSSTPVTDQRRAQMREKWGIKDKSVN